MTATRSIPWLRVLIEGVVIVGSILLAFGIDAWWEGRQERALEREYLERLALDFERNEELIDFWNTGHTQAIHAARAVFPLVSAGEWNGLDTVSAVVASYHATPSGTPTWAGDTYEELRSTGNMGIIRNANLRAALLDYYSYLETEDYSYEFMSTDYRDAVRMRMSPDLQLTIRRDCERGVIGCEDNLNGMDLSDYVRWLGQNRALADGLTRVIVQWTRARDDFLPEIDARTETVSKLIEAN